MASLVRQHPECERTRLVLSCVRRATDSATSDLAALHLAVGRLWLAGAPIDWTALHEGDRPHRVPLPTYPFTRKRHWPDAATGARAGSAALYVPTWRRAPATTGGPAEGQAWLVAGADEDLARAVTDAVAERGGKAVVVGATDVEAELDRLGDFTGLLWLMEPDGTPEALRRLRDVLVAVGSRPESDALRVVVATRAAEHVLGGEQGAPADHAVIPVLGSAAAEFTEFGWEVVDLPPDRAETDARQLAAALAGGTAGGVTAVRGGYRWIRAFDRLPLPAPDQGLRPDGSYLLTGEWCPSARAVATALADQVARLVLACRTADGGQPSESDLAVVRGRRAEVVVRELDLDDVESVQSLAVGDDGRPVDGIIHLLGDPGRRRGLEDSGPLVAVVEQVLAELTALDLAAEAAGVDSCVLLGSLPGWLGGPGLSVPGVRTAVAGAVASAQWSAGVGRWVMLAIEAPAGGDSRRAGWAVRTPYGPSPPHWRSVPVPSWPSAPSTRGNCCAARATRRRPRPTPSPSGTAR